MSQADSGCRRVLLGHLQAECRHFNSIDISIQIALRRKEGTFGAFRTTGIEPTPGALLKKRAGGCHQDFLHDIGYYHDRLDQYARDQPEGAKVHCQPDPVQYVPIWHRRQAMFVVAPAKY